MKRARLIGLVTLIAVLGMLLMACGSSPKSRADDFISYLPEEVGDWELDDTTQLLDSTVSSKGHAILTYEGDDDAIAYVIIEVFPSEDSADVAATNRERELLLQGLELDTDRAARQATAQVAQAGLVRYALLHESDIVVEINTLAAEEDAPVSDEAFELLLTMVRGAFGKFMD